MQYPAYTKSAFHFCQHLSACASLVVYEGAHTCSLSALDYEAPNVPADVPLCEASTAEEFWAAHDRVTARLSAYRPDVLPATSEQKEALLAAAKAHGRPMFIKVALNINAYTYDQAEAKLHELACDAQRRGIGQLQAQTA